MTVGRTVPTVEEDDVDNPKAGLGVDNPKAGLGSPRRLVRGGVFMFSIFEGTLGCCAPKYFPEIS